MKHRFVARLPAHPRSWPGRLRSVLVLGRGRLNHPAADHAGSRWGLALFAFALGSLSTLALVAGAYFAINRSRQSLAPLPHPTRVFSRQDFSRLVMGKSEEEVIHAVGRPDATSEDDVARYWHFKSRTLDALTQEKDSDAQVVIEGGKVIKINY